jgi:hypothetical protein
LVHVNIFTSGPGETVGARAAAAGAHLNGDVFVNRDGLRIHSALPLKGDASSLSWTAVRFNDICSAAVAADSRPLNILPVMELMI